MVQTNNLRQPHAAPIRSIASVLFIGALLVAMTGCGQKKEAVEDGSATSEETNVMAIDATASAQDLLCNPNTNPGVDCACFDNLIAGNWSDDLDTDISSILADPTDDFPQESIDVMIDVALQADDKCSAQN